VQQAPSYLFVSRAFYRGLTQFLGEQHHGTLANIIKHNTHIVWLEVATSAGVRAA